MRYIEQLSQEISWHRRSLAVKEWLRREYIKLDDKRRPARSALQHWTRKIKRAVAFWLLK